MNDETISLDSIREAMRALGPRPPTVEIWVNPAIPLQDAEGKEIPAVVINRREARESLARTLPVLKSLLEKEPVHPEIVIMLNPIRYLEIATLIPANIPVHWAGGIEKLVGVEPVTGICRFCGKDGATNMNIDYGGWFHLSCLKADQEEE